MVSGRDTDHLPKVDYLGKLHERLAGFVHVQNKTFNPCDKIGAASADIYLREGLVMVEHDSRRLDIQTADPPAVIDRIKHIWRRDLRGPNLRDRSARAATN